MFPRFVSYPLSAMIDRSVAARSKTCSFLQAWPRRLTFTQHLAHRRRASDIRRRDLAQQLLGVRRRRRRRRRRRILLLLAAAVRIVLVADATDDEARHVFNDARMLWSRASRSRTIASLTRALPDAMTP